MSVDRLVQVARGTAYAVGAGAATSALAVGVLRAEVEIARRVIGDGPGVSYDDNGRYGAGFGDPVRLLLLGDSTASGVGAGGPDHTVGATVATAVAALSGRPVELRNVSRSGATSPQLTAQVERGLEVLPGCDVAVIMIGANDVKERLDRSTCVRHLGQAVSALRAAGAAVVVGTCPDLGTIRPIPQPLRSLVRRWSRQLAADQTVAVVEAGGRTVSTGDLLGPAFEQAPLELFSEDRFHPSAAGYARVAAALLPSVCDALGLWPVGGDQARQVVEAERVAPLELAAERAAEEPGAEVSAPEGAAPGPGARLARLVRRPRPQPLETAATAAADGPASGQ